ncbi:HEPN domain-containing protein [Patescibacteria group bacterium]|nr:HEPN domain-containing protein [Patescibacteria group bacterium]
MTQKQALNLWLAGANDAFDTAKKLYSAKKFDHCLFFVHLALEKIIKAIFIKKKDTFPPLIHNLAKLAETAGILLAPQQKSQLNEATEFNVSGRYEDYKFKLYKKATPQFTKNWLQTAKTLFEYFKREL